MAEVKGYARRAALFYKKREINPYLMTKSVAVLQLKCVNYNNVIDELHGLIEALVITKDELTSSGFNAVGFWPQDKRESNDLVKDKFPAYYQVYMGLTLRKVPMLHYRIVDESWVARVAIASAAIWTIIAILHIVLRRRRPFYIYATYFAAMFALEATLGKPYANTPVYVSSLTTRAALFLLGYLILSFAFERVEKISLREGVVIVVYSVIMMLNINLIL